jgi:hypothetical protein
MKDEIGCKIIVDRINAVIGIQSHSEMLGKIKFGIHPKRK